MLLNYVKSRSTMITIVLFILCLICLFYMSLVSTASADTPVSWDKPIITKSKNHDPVFGTKCSQSLVELVDVEQPKGSTTFNTTEIGGCVTYGEDVDIISFNINREQKWAIRFHNSSDLFYSIDDMGFVQSLSLVPNSNRVNYKYSFETNDPDGTLGSVTDIMKSIHLQAQDNKLVDHYSYTFDVSDKQNQYWFGRSYIDRWGNIIQPKVTSYGTISSQNGRFLFTLIDYQALVKVDTETGEVRMIAPGFVKDENGISNSQYPGLISNDGSVAFVGSTFRYINMTESCGFQINESMLNYNAIKAYSNAANCPMYDLTPQIDSVVGYKSYSNASHFEDNERTIIAYTGIEKFNYYERNDEIKISLGNIKKLNYLALGDSFTSGQGEVIHKGTYNQYSIKEANSCKNNTLSYPYLLAQKWGYNSTTFKSVACGGTVVYSDYFKSPSVYNGQNNRIKLTNLETSETIQHKALDAFIPGITPQLEFVKKYQPSTITITGGGNDIGFSDIIKYCATPHWEVIFVNNTCDYAKDGSELSKTLNDSIRYQYGNTVRLINTIKKYSPDSRIIYVGYPTFLGSNFFGCANQVVGLSTKERAMVDDSVIKLNNIIKQAVRDTYVKYADIENSLVGGRLCEGADYVTGIQAIGPVKGGRDGTLLDDMFHPNAEGHKRMAAAANKSQKTPNEADINFSDLISDTTTMTQRSQLLNSSVYDDTVGKVKIQTDNNSFKPNTDVTVIAYSDPTKLLGSKTNEEGALIGDVDLSVLPIGNHVVVVMGTGFSGLPVRYFQFLQKYPINYKNNVVNSFSTDPAKANKKDSNSNSSNTASLPVDQTKKADSNSVDKNIQNINNPQSSHNDISNHNSIVSNKLLSVVMPVLGIMFVIIGGVIYVKIKRKKNVA